MNYNEEKRMDAVPGYINKVFYLRGEKVMLEEDVAALFEIELKKFRQKVSRNAGRFPPDFRFVPTAQEWQNLQLQMETPSKIGDVTIPAVFTEHGILMASGLINTNRAIKISIEIINQLCSFFK